MKAIRGLLLIVLLVAFCAPSAFAVKQQKPNVRTDNLPQMSVRPPSEAERAEEKVKFDAEYATLMPRAEAGDQAAQLRLSELMSGNCSCFNIAQSNSWLEMAASSGNMQAQIRLADSLYQGGQKSPAEIALALSWYLKAAEQGDIGNETTIGRIYSSGNGKTPDDATAVKWFQKAADRGDDEALGYLVYSYSTGKGVPKDESKAFALTTTMAEKLPSCDSIFRSCPQLLLAQMYYFGTGTTVDKQQAAQWFIKAAEAKDVVAQLAAGSLFEKGDGVKASSKSAAYWRKAAINQLNSKSDYDLASQLRLGWILHEGIIAPRDNKRAAHLFSKAGRYGSYSLATMYEDGRYVPQDLERAFELYQIAVADNFEEAKKKIADPKFAGILPFIPDPDIAIYPTWLMRQNAEQGEAQAQFRMGGFYEEGKLVRANIRIAKGWYALAAEQGHAEAKEALKRLTQTKSTDAVSAK